MDGNEILLNNLDSVLYYIQQDNYSYIHTWSLGFNNRIKTLNKS